MNVADLQQLLDDIGRLLATAGARVGAVNELAAFREGLAPFHTLPLKKLTELLVQADAAARGAAHRRGPAAKHGRRGKHAQIPRPLCVRCRPCTRG